jgi:hypothetical protein
VQKWLNEGNEQNSDKRDKKGLQNMFAVLEDEALRYARATWTYR